MAEPTLTTSAGTDITTNSFTANGEIVETGGMDVNERGFCYLEGTSGTPTTASSMVSEFSINGGNIDVLWENNCDSLDELGIDVDDPEYGLAEISPSGQLHMVSTGIDMSREVALYIEEMITEPMTDPTFPFVFEKRIKFDQLVPFTYDFNEDTGQLGAYFLGMVVLPNTRMVIFIAFGSNGIFSIDIDTLESTQIGSVIPKCNETADWQTWRFVLNEDGTCEVLTNDDDINFTSHGTFTPYFDEYENEEYGFYYDFALIVSSEIHIDYFKFGNYESVQLSLSAGTYSLPVSGLNPNTNYRICAYAINGMGVGYGNVIDVETSSYSTLSWNDGPPVQISASGEYTLTSSAGSIDVTIDFENLPLEDETDYVRIVGALTRGFCYIEGTGTPTTSDGVVSASGNFDVESFNTPITGLTPNTLYSYRAFATNPSGTFYGETFTFTTTSEGLRRGKPWEPWSRIAPRQVTGLTRIGGIGRGSEKNEHY